MLSDAELKRIAHQAEIQTFSTESLRRFERAILSQVEQRIRAEEREACAKCRDFVEILPGEMPDDLFETLSSDKDAATECLRIVVRQTLDEYEAAIRARKEKE